MSRLPRLTAKQPVPRLERLGYVVRQPFAQNDPSRQGLRSRATVRIASVVQEAGARAAAKAWAHRPEQGGFVVVPIAGE